MKLIDQCCTLEQAKLLKSLGVRQGSHFYHHPNFETPVPGHTSVKKYGTQYKVTQVKNDASVTLSAFTVAELFVMLPDYYPSWRFKVSESSEERKWIVTIICGPKPPGVDDFHTESSFDRYAKTQAEALATLLIALLETEAITVEEVNARLCA